MDKTALMSLMALPVAANIAGCAEVRPPEENSGSNTVPPAVTPEPSAMPNILFVIADDLSYPHTSAYGNTMVSTPGFDRVARDGALFNNHYVTSPGSSPSRASSDRRPKPTRSPAYLRSCLTASASSEETTICPLTQMSMWLPVRSRSSVSRPVT